MKPTITIKAPNWAEAPDWAKNELVLMDECGTIFYRNWYRKGSVSPDPESPLTRVIFKRPEPGFQPPWDKVASPYDEWFCATGFSAGYFCATGLRLYCKDLWTTPDDLKRAEPGKLYRRLENVR